MRVAYFVLFITLALMSWALSVQSVPLTVDGSPCSFNLLCSCTKPGPRDFGIVSCHNVPFSNFPTALNTSARAFILSMAYNDLRVLEAKQLVSSGKIFLVGSLIIMVINTNWCVFIQDCGV